MSSNRTQTTEIQSNEEKSNSTHWVCCFASESLMKKQADLWIGTRNSSKEKYEKITSTYPVFYRIKNEDVIHIYGHGEKNNNIIYHGDTPLKPADFLKYLKDNKLDSGHKYLEINASIPNQKSFNVELYRLCVNNKRILIWKKIME